MTEANPYAAPTVEDQSAFTPGERDFARMTDQQVKKLYYRSCNVAGIGVLLSLGCIALLVMLTMTGGPGQPSSLGPTETAIFGGILLFYALAVVGIFMRSNWGRILGIIACVLALINIPLGTIIGIIGLVAFCTAPQLFGAGRVTHRAIKAEFKHRKQEAKRRKREAKAGR